MGPKILIADDHEIVREGIRTLIKRSRPDWVIAGEATDGEEAVAAVKDLQPDIVILDITMPRMNGLAAATQITRLNLPVRVLMFTMHDLGRLPEEANNVGAHGFVLKSQASRDLIRAIDQLLAGGTFYGSPAPGPEKSLGTAATQGTGSEPTSTKPKQRQRRAFRFLIPKPSWASA